MQIFYICTNIVYENIKEVMKLDRNPTIIFRMTNACNLNCAYCYDRNNHLNYKEENKSFSKRIDKIVQYMQKILSNNTTRSKIIFHGGEPLLIDAANYEELISKILNVRPNVKFSVQTNATLLTKKHIDVFKKYNVSLGISLDGYNKEMNKYRVFSNGRSTFDLVMKKIKLLRQEKMNFGVIMSLTKDIIGHEEELYDFISENNLKCNIRPVFSNSNENDMLMSNDDYFKFFKNIFEIWIEDEKRIRLRQINEIYEEFAKSLDENCRFGKCSSSGECFKNFISLDSNGDLYSCNRTYKNKSFYYGNIEDMTSYEIESKMQYMIKKRQSYIFSSKCKECELFNECKGGCPANSYIKYGNIYSMDDYFCESKIKIRKYVRDKITEMGLVKEYNEKLNNRKVLKNVENISDKKEGAL